MLLQGQLVQGSPRLYSPPPTRLPSESRGSSAELHADLCAATALDGGESPQPKKKAASKEREKAANELLLIGRSSIRETLHSLLTRRCVLKGRTIGTNWTWGIGGVSGCRGRKKGRKERCPLPRPSSLSPLLSSSLSPLPPEMFLHLCFPLLAARFSSKGRVDGPIKTSIAALLGGGEVCGGKHSPPAEVFVFGISMRNCARGVTRNVRISGGGTEGIWLNAAAQRARSPGSWRLHRLAPSST